MYATVRSALYATMFSDEDGEIYSDLIKLDASFDVRHTTSARLVTLSHISPMTDLIKVFCDDFLRYLDKCISTNSGSSQKICITLTLLPNELL